MTPRRPATVRDSQTLAGHLVAAAERLLSRHGAAGLTVRAIAREAQVADGVLYNHFTDKEELIALALHARVGAVERDLAPLPAAGSGTLEDNLRAYVTHGLALHLGILPAFAGLLAHPKILHRFAALDVPVEQGPPLRATLTAYLRAEQALGRLSPQADPDAAAIMIVGACHELILPHLFHGTPAAEITFPPGFADRLVETCLSGIAPPGTGGV